MYSIPKILRLHFLSFSIILMVSSFSFAENQYSIIEKGDKKGLINEKGEIIIPAEYDDLGWSHGLPVVVDNTIGFKIKGKWGLLNTKNKKLIPAEYQDLYPFYDEALICSRKSLGDIAPQYGVINTKGKLLIEFKYDHLEKNGDKLIARVRERNNIFYGLLDDNGKVLISFKFKKIAALSDHLYAVSSDLFNYEIYNDEGISITSKKYDSIGVFSNGLAKIFKNGRQGLIGENGSVVVKADFAAVKINENGKIRVKPFPKWTLIDNKNRVRGSFYYEKIMPFEKSIFKASVSASQALVNIDNKHLTPFKSYNFLQLADTLVSYSLKGKQGIATIYGHEIVPPVYDSVYIDSPHLLLYSNASNNKGWKLADLKGNILTTESYGKIHRLNDSFFKMKKGEFWGIMDKAGQEKIMCKYDSIENFFEGRLKVHFFGENGILNEYGHWIIMPRKQQIDLLPGDKYLVRSIYGSEVRSFNTGLLFKTDYFLYPHGEAFLEKNLDGLLGLLDKNGTRLSKTIYTGISMLNEDSLYIARKGSATSFITKSGKVLNFLDPRFQEIMPMSETFIGVKIDDKYGFVDPNGDLRIANRYEGIGPFNEGLAPVKILGKWGFVNKIERLVIQPRYEEVPTFYNGVFLVNQDGKYGIIDTGGKALVRTEFNTIEKLESGAYVCQYDEKFGLINRHGRMMILPRFDQIEDLGNGFIITMRKGKYGLLSSEGLDVIPMMYDNIIYDQHNDLYICKTNAEWREY